MSPLLQGVMDGVPASRGYRDGFASSLMVKDLGLALDAAGACGAATPMTERALELYQRVAKNGDPTLDFSALFQQVYGGAAAPG